MSSRESNILFDDLFTVESVDKDGKKFDRVSRLAAHSSNFDMALTLDFNIELYPLHSGEEFSLALSSSLERDGGSRMAAMDGEDSKEEKERDVWRPDGKGRRGLDDDYEYVMYGKVYKFEEGPADSETVTVYASFGGLLMSLTGSYRYLQGIVMGENVYLLMRR